MPRQGRIWLPFVPALGERGFPVCFPCGGVTLFGSADGMVEVADGTAQ